MLGWPAGPMGDRGVHLAGAWTKTRSAYRRDPWLGRYHALLLTTMEHSRNVPVTISRA